MSVVCTESSLCNIIRVHTDLMMPTTEIKLAEEPSAAQFIQELLHNWNGEFVLDCFVVKSSKIHTEAPAAIMLAY